MYMSCIEEHVKEEIIKAFTKDCNLRIVFGSTAFKFGMKVDFYDVNKSFSPSCSTDVFRKLGVLDVMAIFLLQFYYMVTSSRDYTVVSRDMDVMKLCRGDVFQTLVNISIHLIKMTACV